MTGTLREVVEALAPLERRAGSDAGARPGLIPADRETPEFRNVIRGGICACVRVWAVLLVGVLALALGTATASAAPAFSARGSVGQVYVTGAAAGAQLALVNGAGQTIATRAANSLGGTLFRNVPPGGGYRVRPAAGGEASGPLTVLSSQSAPPSTSVYNQSIPADGYGYLTTRDGTQLAINVHPPQDVADAVPLPDGVELPPLPTGPTPTLIEYSGYGYADPAGPQSGIAVLANLMGFTVVDVNMRGTGCSGGAFDFFEPLQSLDGYDVVETIARQPWVANDKVGMMGISYGGISQLFTAATQPPQPGRDLAAVGDRLHPDDALPGRHPQHRVRRRVGTGAHPRRQGRPRATEGQPWAYKRIQEGDPTCAANQALHPEAVDLMAKIRANDHYVPRSPTRSRR